MSKLVPINSVEEIATKMFAGQTEMARWCNISRSNISAWVADNVVPKAWRYKLHREAQRRNYIINPTLFEDKISPDEKSIFAKRAS